MAVSEQMGYMPLQFGKVIAVNKAARTVDVFLIGGGTLKNVRVLAPVAGSHEGSAYLPDVTVTADEPSMVLGGSDTYCVVGYLSSDFRQPIVMGLLFPTNFESSFAALDVNKRAGGSYTAFDADGFEINRPDGTFIRVGTSTTRVVDGATNSGKTPFDRTTGTAVGVPHIFISHSSGLKIDITTSGQIQITKAGGGSFFLETHTHSDPQGGSTGIPV